MDGGLKSTKLLGTLLNAQDCQSLRVDVRAYTHTHTAVKGSGALAPVRQAHHARLLEWQSVAGSAYRTADGLNEIPPFPDGRRPQQNPDRRKRDQSAASGSSGMRDVTASTQLRTLRAHPIQAGDTLQRRRRVHLELLRSGEGAAATAQRTARRICDHNELLASFRTISA